jgi:hypothetical protein
MFPTLRRQALARVDLLVELATLGEYGVDERGRAMALDGPPAPDAASLSTRTRDRCGAAGVRRRSERPGARAPGVPARP